MKSHESRIQVIQKREWTYRSDQELFIHSKDYFKQTLVCIGIPEQFCNRGEMELSNIKNMKNNYV